MHKDVQEIYFSAEEIDKKVTEIANQLNEYYKGEEVLMVGI